MRAPTPAESRTVPLRGSRFSAGLAVASLAAVTAVVMTLFAFTLSGPSTLAVPGADAEILVLEFYQAVNQTLETGIPATSGRGLAREARIQSSADSASLDQDEYFVRLAEIGRRQPGLRLHIVMVVADGDQASAHVSLIRSDQLIAVPSGPGTGEWVEWFRIAGDEIVEVRGLAQLISAAERTIDEYVEVQSGPNRVGVAQFLIEPEAVIPVVSLKGPAIVIVEEGELRAWIEIANPVEQSREETTVEGYDTVVIRPQDRLVLDPGTSVGLRNETERVTTALIAAVIPMQAPGSWEMSTPIERPNPLQLAMFGSTAGDTTAIDSPLGWGVTVVSMGTLQIDIATTKVRFTTDQLTIFPDTEIQELRVNHQGIIAVVRGHLMMTWSTPQQHAVMQMTSVAPFHPAQLPPEGATVRVLDVEPASAVIWSVEEV